MTCPPREQARSRTGAGLIDPDQVAFVGYGGGRSGAEQDEPAVPDIPPGRLLHVVVGQYPLRQKRADDDRHSQPRAP